MKGHGFCYFWMVLGAAIGSWCCLTAFDEVGLTGRFFLYLILGMWNLNNAWRILFDHITLSMAANEEGRDDDEL